MARLPQPGGDQGNWGGILNEYLLQIHNTDGTLKNNIVTSASLAPSSVDITALGGAGVTDGNILMSDSGSPTGFVWATASSGGPVSVVTMAGDITGQSNTSVIADGAVTVDKIGDGVVTAAKLADASVTTAKLAPGAVTAAMISNNAITEPKISTPASPTNGQFLGWDGTQLAWATVSSTGGASTLSGDVSGTLVGSDIATAIAASSITTTMLNDNSVTSSKLANGAVGASAILDDNVTEQKLQVSNAPALNNVLAWNGTNMTWVPPSATSAALDDLTDVNASAPTDGQVLSFSASGTEWVPSTIASTVVSDATVSAKGIVQLTGDLGGTASAPTVPALANKAESSRQITTSGSLVGGGNLTVDRTISLANDSAAPGASRYYGTDGAGAKGYFALPSGGGASSLTGDVTGIESGGVIATTIANTSVTTAKIAASAVTVAKLSSAGATSGDVLTYNGVSVAWAAPSGGGGATWNPRHVTASTTAVDGDWILADSSSGSVTVTLPLATSGARVRVKRKTGSGNSIIVSPSGGAQIDLGEPTSTTVNGGFMCVDYEADGTNWWAVGSF